VNVPRISVRNPVAVNLLMVAVIVGGLYYWFTLIRVFFPNIEADRVFITVAYPGATPEEVEKSVTTRIEREIEDVEDIEEVTARILEGATVVSVTLDEGADLDRVLNDLRGEVDKVRPELPDGAEDPEIVELRPRIPVIAVMVYGHVSEERLREEARDVRDELLDLPEISDVSISGIREREIWAEVRLDDLERYGLTFEEMGQVVAASNLDVPGGQIKGALGNIRVRTVGETDRARQLEELIVRSRPDGSAVRLRDVAAVTERFEDKVERGRFRGKPACNIVVFKAPEEDALKISAVVKQHVVDNPTRLGGAVQLETTTDLARFINQRLELMLRNAGWGLVFVLIALSLFLNLRVAFWVGAGLPIAFLGTFIVMKVIGVSINLISLFGLIVVLGLIVDDAIVVGENVFTRIRKGVPAMEAAVDGASEVSLPVLAAVLTTIVAFLPLAFIEGQLGTFLGVLPKVVIAALLMSLVECFLILPAHLRHSRRVERKGLLRALTSSADKVGDFKSRLVEVHLAGLFEWILRRCLRWRYVTLAAAIAFTCAIVGLVAGGTVETVFIQDVDAESIWINLEMSAGTPEERTEEVIAALEEVAESYEEVASVFAVLGSSYSEEGRKTAADPATVGQLNIELLPADEREARQMRTSRELVNQMRRKAARVPGVLKLSFVLKSGGPAGPDIEIRVRGEDMNMVAKAVAYVRGEIAKFDGIVELEDDLKEGKQEIQLKLRDNARPLGLTTRSLALTVRHALFGFEAQDLQEDDEEVTVRVVLPEGARRDVRSLARLRIRTPAGGRVPLQEVADLSTGRGYASLSRADGKRAVTVKAQVDEEEANVAEISEVLGMTLADIATKYPGVSISFEGQKKEMAEAFGSLWIGFLAALLIIYAVIAVVFRSYLQPLIVMLAIPFSLVGAVLGHYFMGYPLTILSRIGAVALAGIVVNDSLILVDFINRLRRKGTPIEAAAIEGAKARLRAILLTTITTCLGLAPLMLERSFQAQFLIPMAVSIVFGLAFATVLTLILVPAVYLILDDVLSSLRWLFDPFWWLLGYRSRGAPQAAATAEE